ncbi:MAG: PD-(D/E)XK nuclease family protein [Gammaproteobacteria bacterium]|nr:PD-(D/E)XK nuclease family protein [Gammaproteobacteria bacterium]
MKIILGLHADGMNTQPKDNRLGIKTVGPQGFLIILETQLGIPVRDISHTSRVVSYLKRMESAGIEGRFFERSYSVDKFNVATELLSWRDQWFLGGWNGRFESTAEKKLLDVGNIDKETHIALAPGEGERLQTILSLLSEQETQIIEVQLQESIDHFPKAWKQVIQSFKWNQADTLSPDSIAETDLYKLQQSLLGLGKESSYSKGVEEIGKVTLKGDGTFQTINATSKAVSALAIASFLKVGTSETVLLSGSEGVELDEAFERNDMPRLGFKKYSSARPILQLLPLAIDLLWEPLNPETLLEFLLLPYAPLPKGLRRSLASVVADTPGMNGEAWNRVVEKLLEKEDEKAQKQLKDDIELWLNTSRFVVAEGIPIETLHQRIIHVANWIAARLALDYEDSQLALFRAANNQANELALVLGQFEDQKESLSTEQIHYLIEQVTGSGTDLIDRYAECSSDQLINVVAANSPSNLNRHFDTVIWWDIQGQQKPQTTFSSSELDSLLANGVELILPETLYKIDAVNSLKPILSATNRLMLVVHDDCDNHHPLMDLIISSMEGWQAITLDDELLRGQVLGDETDNMLGTDFKPLPAYRRWWQLTPFKGMGKRDKESFSSLELMFKSPYQWVLNYKAHLRSGGLTEIADGNLLKGTLIHHLYELFFQSNEQVLTDGVLDKPAIESWFDHAFNELLHQEGLVLLQPGRGIEKARFEETAKRSLFALIEQLRAANVIEIEMEGKNEGLFFGGKLTGDIDVRVVNRDGIEAIVDIKWGGKSYREASLSKNEHLQLVIYSYLRGLKLKEQGWPSVAYFIIDESVMLSQDNSFFPNAWIVNKESDESIKQVWQRMKKTWQWRREQIDHGLIEVTVANTEPGTDSQPGADGLEIPDKSDFYNDYAALTGWRKS